MRIIFILSLLIIFFKTSCTNKPEKNIPTKYLTFDKSFKNIIKEEVGTEKYLNAEIALKSILRLWNKNKNIEVESNENPINLYMIYGTDFWSEYEKTFEITFAHQQVNPKNKELYEHRITLVYPPANFKNIEEMDIRLKKDVSEYDFKKILTDTKGFKQSLLYKPTKIIIESEII